MRAKARSVCGPPGLTVRPQYGFLLPGICAPLTFLIIDLCEQLQDDSDHHNVVINGERQGSYSTKEVSQMDSCSDFAEEKSRFLRFRCSSTVPPRRSDITVASSEPRR
jgi:hypothetical protein